MKEKTAARAYKQTCVDIHIHVFTIVMQVSAVGSKAYS